MPTRLDHPKSPKAENRSPKAGKATLSHILEKYDMEEISFGDEVDETIIYEDEAETGNETTNVQNPISNRPTRRRSSSGQNAVEPFISKIINETGPCLKSFMRTSLKDFFDERIEEFEGESVSDDPCLNGINEGKSPYRKMKTANFNHFLNQLKNRVCPSLYDEAIYEILSVSADLFSENSDEGSISCSGFFSLSTVETRDDEKTLLSESEQKVIVNLSILISIAVCEELISVDQLVRGLLKVAYRLKPTLSVDVPNFINFFYCILESLISDRVLSGRSILYKIPLEVLVDMEEKVINVKLEKLSQNQISSRSALQHASSTELSTIVSRTIIEIRKLSESDLFRGILHRYFVDHMDVEKTAEELRFEMNKSSSKLRFCMHDFVRHAIVFYMDSVHDLDCLEERLILPFLGELNRVGIIKTDDVIFAMIKLINVIDDMLVDIPHAETFLTKTLHLLMSHEILPPNFVEVYSVKLNFFSHSETGVGPNICDMAKEGLKSLTNIQHPKSLLEEVIDIKESIKTIIYEGFESRVVEDCGNQLNKLVFSNFATIFAQLKQEEDSTSHLSSSICHFIPHEICGKLMMFAIERGEYACEFSLNVFDYLLKIHLISWIDLRRSIEYLEHERIQDFILDCPDAIDMLQVFREKFKERGYW